MATISCCVLHEGIFNLLCHSQLDSGEEIQLSDAISCQAKKELVEINKFNGQRFDLVGWQAL